MYQLRSFRTPSISEIIRARFVWTYIVLKSHFDQDIKLLLAGKEFKDSKLITLDPCIKNNLLRVGLVQASLLDPDEKPPLILPFNCKFSKLIIG